MSDKKLARARYVLLNSGNRLFENPDYVDRFLADPYARKTFLEDLERNVADEKRRRLIWAKYWTETHEIAKRYAATVAPLQRRAASAYDFGCAPDFPKYKNAYY